MFKKQFTTVVSFTLLLGACASGADQTSSSDLASPSVASPSVASSPMAKSPATSLEPSDHSAPAQGGQVVETGDYHLELVALPEASSTHLDLFLQTGDTHEAVEGAAVTGQIQLPDGSQKEVDFEYDAEGEHYTALLPEAASGEYKVVILTDIKGEKVNGRFSFTK
jgi:hypothetical protein